MIAASVLPPERMGDIHQVMVVQGAVNPADAVFQPRHRAGQTFDVLIGPRHVEGAAGVAEIDLRINDYQVDVHDVRPSANSMSFDFRLKKPSSSPTG